MRILILFLLFFGLSEANSIIVDERKSDIFFANGILTSKKEAEYHLKQRLKRTVLSDLYNYYIK